MSTDTGFYRELDQGETTQKGDEWKMRSPSIEPKDWVKIPEKECGGVLKNPYLRVRRPIPEVPYAIQSYVNLRGDDILQPGDEVSDDGAPWIEITGGFGTAVKDHSPERSFRRLVSLSISPPEVSVPVHPNDPKGEAGSKKCPLHLIPPHPMEEAAWVHALGASKYGPYNWRTTNVNATTYVSAILRHLNAWRDGEDLDPESGRSHLAHIIASCNIVLDAREHGTLVDDRPR